MPSTTWKRIAGKAGQSFAERIGPAQATVVQYQALAVLWIAAGVSALLTLAVGVDATFDREVIAALALTAVVNGVLVAAHAHRLSPRCFAPMLLAGIFMVSAAVLASGEADSPYVMFYFWAAAEGWYFLRPRTAAILTLVTAIVSGAAMAAAGDTDGDTLGWWLLVCSTLLVVSGLAALLRLRSDFLIRQLNAAAIEDPLTGLLNRRGYEKRVEQELARAGSSRAPLSVALGDLDDFKALNDRFGHRYGDTALQQLANCFRRHLRDSDFVARVGGEEFVIVMTDTDESEAILAAERLRRAIREELRTPDGSPLTASFGVAAYPRHAADAHTLLDHADQAMYAAKTLGRDRTVAFDDSLPRTLVPAVNGEHSLQAVILLAEALDMRDPGTGAHSQTVARHCSKVAVALGLADDRVAQIQLAGLLHDVGKIAVPDDVLLKPGQLTPAEWSQMQKHPEIGARIVAAAGLDEISRWILAHHERPDGTGYPYRLPDSEIPLEARILAIADAYEAMTADRPYRQAMGPERAAAELRSGAGRQFDAALVETFLTTLHPMSISLASAESLTSV